MSLTVTDNQIPQDYSATAAEQNENQPAVKDQPQPSEPVTNTNQTASANYSEAQTNNSMASAQKAMLMAKLSPANRPTSDANSSTKQTTAQPASTTPAPSRTTIRSGISVNIADVQTVIAPNDKGQRAANQGIRVGYSIESNGTNKPLSADELTARSERDKALRLTDDKGQLTTLGEQFQKLPNDGRAIITEPGTTPYQLVTLVNGGQPSPEKAAVIISGLISKGLATISTDAQGQAHLNVVPYKAASANQVINAGYENETQLKNIKAILPGLKEIEGLGILAASTYGGAAIAAVAAPLGPVAAGAISGIGGKNIETVIKEQRLATIKENFEAGLVGGLTGGLSTVGSNSEIIELGLSAATKARIAITPTASSALSILEGKSSEVSGLPKNVNQELSEVNEAVHPNNTLSEENPLADSLSLFRREKNVGPYKDLPVLMELKTVKDVANKAGVDLSGIKVRIIRNPELVGTQFTGYTHPDGKFIDIYPDAFQSNETLARTIGHERTHAFQVKLLGPASNSVDLKAYEDAAYGTEQMFEDYYHGKNPFGGK